MADDPSLAGAWITLADLLYNDKWELSEARVAARQAYEEDVFLLEDDHFVWLCEISLQLRTTTRRAAGARKVASGSRIARTS